MANDYIRREDAIMQLSHNKRRGDDEWELAVESDMDVIRKLPSADVVPVVRCKVCRKHSYDPLFGYWWCNLTLGTRRVKPDDFCSYGERKE